MTKRYECPVDDICDCVSGVCERAPKPSVCRSELASEFYERPFETTLDDLERQD